MRYANQHTGTIVIYNMLPKTWVDNITGQLILGFQSSTEEAYQEQGFYELVEPVYDIDTQYLGVVYWVALDEVFTYDISDYTDEQLQQKDLEKAIVEQDELVAKNIKIQVLQNAQVYDDSDALNNKALYLQWQYPVNYDKDFKVQAFSAKALKDIRKGKATKASTELLLYKCLQPHTSQVDWQPSETPSLWVEIVEEGTIPIYKQPTGAHDAYNKGRQVHYPTENDTIYTSTVDANVYAPNVVLGQWEAI